MARHNHTLPTQLEAGLARWARRLAAADKAHNWASRLDSTAYTAERDGEEWVAVNAAAGQEFRYRKTPLGIECHSQSGGAYLTSATGCTCPAHQRDAAPCKHMAGFSACCREAQRERVRRELLKVKAPARVAA